MHGRPAPRRRHAVGVQVAATTRWSARAGPCRGSTPGRRRRAGPGRSGRSAVRATRRGVALCRGIHGVPPMSEGRSAPAPASGAGPGIKSHPADYRKSAMHLHPCRRASDGQCWCFCMPRSSVELMDQAVDRHRGWDLTLHLVEMVIRWHSLARAIVHVTTVQLPVSERTSSVRWIARKLVRVGPTTPTPAQPYALTHTAVVDLGGRQSNGRLLYLRVCAAVARPALGNKLVQIINVKRGLPGTDFLPAPASSHHGVRAARGVYPGRPSAHGTDRR